MVEMVETLQQLLVVVELEILEVVETEEHLASQGEQVEFTQLPEAEHQVLVEDSQLQVEQVEHQLDQALHLVLVEQLQ